MCSCEQAVASFLHLYSTGLLKCKEHFVLKKCTSSFTINADLAISIFVCSFEKCFCFIISQISALLRKALQNIPKKNTGCRRDTMQDMDLHTICIALFWSSPLLCAFVFVSISLELICLYEAASIHIQNLEDLLDTFS